MMPSSYVYRRRVAYHETDAMGVLHHANHIKYFEEARVAWMRDRGMLDFQRPYDRTTFAVIKLANRYFKPVQFEDDIEIILQTRAHSAVRVEFQYAMWSRRIQAIVGDGNTVLVPIKTDFKPGRMDAGTLAIFQREPWDEQWPPKEPPARG